MYSIQRVARVSRAVIVVACAALLVPSRAAAQAPSQLPPEVVAYADTILTNGKILTVDKSFSIRDAIAIRDGRVLAVGTTAAIERMAGPNTKKIDLAGKSVIPGIIDTHSHPWNGALARHAKD